MSDDNERDDDPVPVVAPTGVTEAQPSVDAPGPGRRTEPSQPGGLVDGVPYACHSAAYHVANCERCLAALRAYLDDSIAATVAALLGEKTH
jgi:hypothetical protein